MLTYLFNYFLNLHHDGKNIISYLHISSSVFIYLRIFLIFYLEDFLLNEKVGKKVH